MCRAAARNDLSDCVPARAESGVESVQTLRCGRLTLRRAHVIITRFPEIRGECAPPGGLRPVRVTELPGAGSVQESLFFRNYRRWVATPDRKRA